MNAQLLGAALLAAAVGILIGWLVAARRSSAVAVELAAARERAEAHRVQAALHATRAEQHRADAEAAAARHRADAEALAAQHRDAGELHRLTLAEVAKERDQHLAQHLALKPHAERLPDIEAALTAARAEVRELGAIKAGFERGEAERTRAYEAQLEQLRDLEAKVEARFGELAKGAVDQAHKQFLDHAQARFKASEDAAGQNLSALLQPVKDRLQRYEEHVTKAEAERRDAFGLLSGQIEAMRTGSDRVSAEAAKLVNALRNAPKARGRWGEQQLRNVLEKCGLSEHTDFRTEVSVDDGEGTRLRPDAVVSIPGGKSLVIDAKVSLNAYQDAFDAVDEVSRKAGLDAHAASLRAHVNALGNKGYWNQFADAPEFVIMFIPGEHFLNAALDHDPNLWEYAFERHVLLATPTNLIAIARTVEGVWRQEKIARQAAEIAQVGKQLYARLAVTADHMEKVGRGLRTAVAAYNGLVGNLDTNVLASARKLEALDVETGGRAIESPALIDEQPREPAKLLALAATSSGG